MLGEELLIDRRALVEGELDPRHELQPVLQMIALRVRDPRVYLQLVARTIRIVTSEPQDADRRRNVVRA